MVYFIYILHPYVTLTGTIAPIDMNRLQLTIQSQQNKEQTMCVDLGDKLSDTSRKSTKGFLRELQYRHNQIQWNLSVTTTSIIKSISCDLFSNVF